MSCGFTTSGFTSSGFTVCEEEVIVMQQPGAGTPPPRRRYVYPNQLRITVSGELQVKLPIVKSGIAKVQLPIAKHVETPVRLPILLGGSIQVKFRNWLEVFNGIQKVEKLLQILDVIFYDEKLDQKELHERLTIAQIMQTWKDRLKLGGAK